MTLWCKHFPIYGDGAGTFLLLWYTVVISDGVVIVVCVCDGVVIVIL